jgi:BlaI family transcriptional regulator, penicillinase repressor
MPRKSLSTFTDAELRIMNVLWNLGAGTVNEVLDGISGQPPLAYNTVLTMLRILEDKGHVTHDKEGRAFIYRPTVARDQAQGSALKLLLNRFFENSAEKLVQNLLQSQKLTPDELNRMKRMLQEADKS